MISRHGLFMFAAVISVAAANEPVRTETGLISSADASTPDVRIYKGIPYAAPPLGDLRWHAPKAAAKWEGVRAGDKVGPVCMQAQRAPQNGEREMSEDCLYLNIYTPTAQTKEP